MIFCQLDSIDTRRLDRFCAQTTSRIPLLDVNATDLVRTNKLYFNHHPRSLARIASLGQRTDENAIRKHWFSRRASVTFRVKDSVPEMGQPGETVYFHHVFR